MIEGAGRFLLELFEELGVRARQLAQTENREAVEHVFEYGQKGEEQNGGHGTAEQTVTHLRKDALDARDFRRRQRRSVARQPRDLQKENDEIDGNDDDEPDNDDLEARLGLIPEEHGDHARGKSDDKGGIDMAPRCI